MAVAQLVNTSMLRLGLAGVAMLEVAAGGEQRAGGDGIAQPGLLRRSAGSGAGRAARCCLRHPVGDAAEAIRVLRPEYGAAGDGHAHAGVERAGGQRRFAEAAPGEGDRESRVHAGAGQGTIHAEILATRQTGESGMQYIVLSWLVSRHHI